MGDWMNSDTGSASGRTALVIGITGQDGQALARFLLSKGYKVTGVSRRVLAEEAVLREAIGDAGLPMETSLRIRNADITDGQAFENLIRETSPNEIYNLAAQSDVAESFRSPIETMRINAEGPLALLEILRSTNNNGIRLYHASSSQMYPPDSVAPQNELTHFNAENPYGISKHFAHLMCVHYRKTYGVRVSCGITFNHEGPARGENFLSRKVTRAVASAHLGSNDPLVLGNLNARRDWGHVRDYVEGMWLMLQHEEAEDFVLATGKVHSVREFVSAAFSEIDIALVWEGEGVNEIGRDAATGKARVTVSEEFFRPESPGLLVGDASKARRLLGWEPKISFEALVSEMVAADITRLKRTANF